jgi:pyruvate,water dikinase
VLERCGAVAEARSRAPTEGEAIAEALQARVRSTALPDDLAGAVGAAYEALGGSRVAVRSSAVAEDSASASFAGQQDSYLDVIGAEAVLERVRGCAASLFNARALVYRARKNVWDLGVAVVVQRMVDARAAGVLFTRDPVRGLDRVVVEAVAGGGERLVSGEAVPDHYEVERASRAVVSRFAPAGRAPVLSDDDLGEVVALGLRCEALFGAPQDVEWAIGDRLYLLQSRPITTG